MLHRRENNFHRAIRAREGMVVELQSHGAHAKQYNYGKAKSATKQWRRFYNRPMHKNNINLEKVLASLNTDCPFVRGVDFSGGDHAD